MPPFLIESETNKHRIGATDLQFLKNHWGKQNIKANQIDIVYVLSTF